MTGNEAFLYYVGMTFVVVSSVTVLVCGSLHLFCKVLNALGLWKVVMSACWKVMKEAKK